MIGRSAPLLSARFLERVAGLEPSARRAAAGRAGGDRPSGAAGAGIVFHEHRAYTPGDDLRYVDWNAFGRLRTMHVKTFEREESLDLHVLIDRSASMGSGGAGPDGPGALLAGRSAASKLEAGARAAAIVGAAALARGDLVRVQAFPSGDAPGDSARDAAGAAPRDRPRSFAGRDATAGYIDELSALAASVPPPGGAPLGAALRETFPELRRRGAALLVTDFLGNEASADAWRRAIDFLLHRRVELTCLHVVSEDERRPRADGPLRLADAETGDEMEIDVDDAVLAEYTARFERHLREVAAYLRGRGARHVLIETQRSGENDILRALLRAGVLR